MRLILFIATLFIATSAVHLESTELGRIYQSCANSSLGVLEDVSIKDCSSAPCILYRGSAAYIAVTFTPNEYIEKVNITIYGLVYGVRFPFLTNENACQDEYKIDCPLKEGETVTLDLEVEIESYYPTWKLYVVAKLESQGEAIICVKVPVKIM